jgi:MFS superfamily sulfate permease-like transporter
LPTKTDHTNTFIKDGKTFFFEAFVVSLIALPLGLGLALAGEAPPISGIIAQWWAALSYPFRWFA